MEQIYLKKTLEFEYAGQRLQFQVAQDLFSSHQIDIGSARLIRSFSQQSLGPFRKVLDLGSGYGVLGLMLKAMYPHSLVHLVDRDALAVAFSARNAALNGLEGVLAYGSLVYDDVPSRDFDCILSNIPGKAGEPVIASILHDARYFLAPQGMVAIVVVTALEPLVKELLSAPDITITYHQSRSGHAVFHYGFQGHLSAPPTYDPGLDRGLYQREAVMFPLGDDDCTVHTARGLAEFDTLGYSTRLLVDALPELGAKAERVAVFNPGQGYVPLAAWKLLAPRALQLVERDLLSLRYARRNLLDNGCPDERIALIHQVGWQLPSAVDLVLGVLREEEGPEALAWSVERAAEALVPDGQMVLAGSSTAITRLSKAASLGARLRIEGRKRHKGQSLVVFRPR